MINIETIVTGPVLAGHPTEVVDIFMHAMESDLSAEGLRRVHDRLGRVLKHPTGYYESRVIRTTRGSGYAVTDSRVIYGPWLEGTGSRNQTTRFKGYRTFRTVGQQLDNDAEVFLQRDINRMTEVLNGN